MGYRNILMKVSLCAPLGQCTLFACYPVYVSLNLLVLFFFLQKTLSYILIHTWFVKKAWFALQIIPILNLNMNFLLILPLAQEVLDWWQLIGGYFTCWFNCISLIALLSTECIVAILTLSSPRSLVVLHPSDLPPQTALTDNFSFPILTLP